MDNSQRKLHAYLKLIGVVFTWGGVYHVAKYLVTGTDIFTVSFIRFFISSIVLLLIYRKKRGAVGFSKSRKHWGMLITIGFLGIFVYNMFFFGAEALIPANNVAILYAFTPCITVLLGYVFLKQQINGLGYFGIAIALLGTVGVISFSDATCGKFFCAGLFNNLSAGQLLAILATISMALYSILNKKAAMMGIDSFSLTTFAAVFGTVFLFVAFLLFGGKAELLLHKSFEFWLAMFYTSVFATVVSYKWYSDAIHTIGVGATSVWLNGVPFSAILIGLVIMGQGIGGGELLSGIVIVGGVLITTFATRKRPE